MRAQQYIFWIVGVASALAMAFAFLTPPPAPNPDDFPWNVERAPSGNTRVLGLTLGGSSIADAEQRFREGAEIAIFRGTDEGLAAEAYFDQINLAGLKSRVVATIPLPKQALMEIATRGVRMSATAEGRKITPHPEDIPIIKRMPIGSLTLIPAVRVSEDVLAKRFGPPEKTVREPISGRQHWLYPASGLDIAIGSAAGEKHVFQFVSPQNFESVMKPLFAPPARLTTSQ